jgi:uncharacterized protein
MKYLWMVVAGLLIFAWLKMRSGRSSDAPHSPRKSKDQVAVVPKNMVECVHCGVHVPHEDAISTQGRSYCCIEHLQKDQDR